MSVREAEQEFDFTKARLKAVFLGLFTTLTAICAVFILKSNYGSSILFLPMGVIVSVFSGCLAFLVSSFSSISNFNRIDSVDEKYQSPQAP